MNDRPDFDCYICGSDQVWNLRLINDPVFYLDFTKHFKGVKKIAYAPSIADPIPPDLVCKVKEYLKNIDAISVRESTDVEVLKSLTDKPVFHVADPVFLLCAEEWSKLLVSPSIKEPYILCFFIHTDPLAVKAVEKLRRLTGYPVVHVNLNVMDKFHSEYCVYDADPFDFIGYIKNAAFVCTNSFHCTAFSLIFKKNYYIVPRRVVNTRMESLHKVFGVQNRFLNLDKVKSMTIDDLSVDYSKFDIGYEFFRDQSINYLKKALEL
ncbi:MAG: polysaccharide pyruvyl transferase family protein [Candidatus Delongbacteria bacterium]|nr:polysaccharide pyruvyl transferase family protein [Candidatus Delongbacteria bacterium]